MNAPLAVGKLDRTKYLGGSDAAALFGVSPWKTAVDLFLDKIRPRSDDDEKLDPAKRKFFARRKRQEPVVAEMLADEYGIVVTRLSLDDNPNRYIDPEHDFMAAEIDFEFLMTPEVRQHFPGRPDFAEIPDGTLLNGEIKTVHPFKASEWGEEGTEEVPIHYAAQVMHGLGITRRPAAIVAALFGLDTLVCFPVMADPEIIIPMRAKCVSFWNSNVLARVTPDPINMADIKRLHGGFGGKPAELTEEAFEALCDIEHLRATKRGADLDLQEAEWRVASCIAKAWGRPAVQVDDGGKVKIVMDGKETAELIFGGREVGSWKRQRGTYLDQKTIRIEHPEITAEYTIEHHYRVFRLKKEK